MSDFWENERRSWKVTKKKYDSEYKPKETVKDILQYPQKAIPERGLKESTIKRFGVRTKLNTLTQEIDAVYFPYKDESGKVTGYKKRDLTLHKKEKYHFSVIGYVGVESQLFGQDKCRSKAKKLYITEGEYDQMSCYQAYMENVGKDYKQYGVNVVSIGCGTPNAVDHITENEHFISGFEQVVLCFDNDSLSERDLKKKNPGMKGAEATNAVGAFLRDHTVLKIKWEKCNKLPNGKFPNDPSDYLKPENNKADWLYRVMLFNTEEYRNKKIVGIHDVFEKGEVLEPLDKGVYLESFPKLMDLLLGIRKKEDTLLLAPSGTGKTSVCCALAADMAEGGEKVGGILLEEGMKRTGQRFIAQRLRIHPNKFQFGERLGKTDDEVSNAEDWVAEKYLFLDHHGAISINELVDLCKLFIYKYNRTFIIFDHISLACASDGTIEERAELTVAMNAITALCESCDVHIVVVAHINRNATTVSSKEREITEPKWKRTFITDGKGTQALEALAHNIITIDKERLPDGTRGRIRLFLGKNRGADTLGFADITRMHPDTGVFYDASDERWTPNGWTTDEDNTTGY